ncbi:MAG: flagellar protein FlaG [Pseudomonadota bacterium]
MIIDSKWNSVTPPTPPGSQVGGGVRASVESAAPLPPGVVQASGSLEDASSSVKNATFGAAGQTGDGRAASVDELKKAVDDANGIIQAVRRDLNLNIDEASGRLVIKVIDRDSEEVIRQIPSEEVLAFIQNLTKMAETREGVLIQEKA